MNEENVLIKFTKCRESAVLPSYAKAFDAGMDIVAAEDVLLAPGETKLVPTGLKVAIPQGYELQVRPRSGLSLNTPLRIPNSPGTIDSGYRDEICVILNNSSIQTDINDILLFLAEQSSGNVINNETIPFNELIKIYFEKHENTIYLITTKGNKQGYYNIKKGDRIAQFVLNKISNIMWEETDSVADEGINRGGGFGSTGHT